MKAHEDTAEHRAARLALPWLLNGTLDKAEREAVDAHIQACARCRDELAALDALRGAASPTDPGCDADRALAGLMPMLESTPQDAPPARGAARAANDSRWLRAALAVQAVAIVALVGLLARPGERDPGYLVLGADTRLAASMVVQFRPDTPERELRRILQASGARILDGPTAAGAYLLDVPEGRTSAALARMRAEPAVQLAESLAAADPP